jgi:uroporphyrinogen III methyltransferase/synthase
MKQGMVYLVGAGPGDPGLITVKGMECLKKADVVIYDRLLDNRLLELSRPTAKRIYVGKSSGFHSLEQDEINQIILKQAKSGKIVVRLKGGDPFVFGRGGEEAEILADNAIPFEIVPGVSSAIAVPAYAGIPVTHRGLAASFIVVTGHEASKKDSVSIDWERISRSADTLVILMGVSNLNSIVDQLLKNGRPTSTPVAVITHGTSNLQQTLVGTLEDIAIKARQANIEPPAVIVVGEVVQLRKKLQWFENRPLFGKRVLVTRAKNQAGELNQILMEKGAIPVELPSISIVPASLELDEYIRKLSEYQWLIFTSVNGVDSFFRRLYELKLDIRKLGNLKVAAIGAATASALKINGILVDCIPGKFTTKQLLNELKKQDLHGCRILLPRADIAGKELSNGLAELGAEVQEVKAYRTVIDKKGMSKTKQMLMANDIDVITFTSSSTVINLLSALGKNRKVLQKSLIACIGPVTADTAKKAGLRVDIVSQKQTMPGLVEAIEKLIKGKQDE